MTLEQEVTNYAHYHRDKRNLATHFIGVPLIVYAVYGLACSVKLFTSGSFVFHAGILLAIFAAGYYFRLDFKMGWVMLLVNLFFFWAATASMPYLTSPVLFFVGVFVVGWIIQFIGHVYEGKKPAFLDDVRGLMTGPLFLVVEAAFAAGLLGKLKQYVESQAGPLTIRERTQAG